MESPYTPNMPSSPFFFYTPEAQSDQRHCHFSPQTPYPAGVPFYPQLVKNPGVNYIQHYPVPDASMIFQNAVFPQQRILTPLASPQPIYPRAANLNDRQSPYLRQLDTHFRPSTPPLSSSGSASSSPPTAYPLLATPSNQSFALPEQMYNTKFDRETFGEILPQPEWMSPSPPQTPEFAYPAAEPTRISATYPISPSPSPLQSVQPTVKEEAGLNFCDPRDLTVQSPLPFGLQTPTSGFPIDEKAASFPFAEVATPRPFYQAPASDFLGTTGLYGLDFDHEFTTFSKSGLAENSFIPNHKRQRIELLSLPEEDSFLNEDSFSENDDDQLAAAWLLTPADLDNSFRSEMPTHLVSTPNTRASVETESDADYPREGTVESGAHPTNSSEQASSAIEGNLSGSDAAMGSSNQDDAGSTPQGSNRRGRKQSLTDDPSKTFICHLCNRRFRRQEHLKRHYRSLHTHDKPFKCADCGKTFSRSDNLAQHQRTHGIGTIALEMNGLETGETTDHQAGSPESDSDRMAQILYQAAQRLANSTTPESSTSGTDESEMSAIVTEKKIRKRKREE